MAIKGTQKNDVNMFCESDASRLAIYISLGHRDTIYFLGNSQTNQKSWKFESHFIGKKFLNSFTVDFSL